MTYERLTHLAEAVVDAWNSHDVARVLAHYTEDIVYSDPSTKLPVWGREALGRHLEGLFASWSVASVLREALPLDGGLGAHVLWTGSFRHRVAGPHVRVDGVALVLFDGDRVLRNDVVFDGRPLSTQLAHGRGTPETLWVQSAIEEVGGAAASRIASRVARATGALEARRILEVMRVERVDTTSALRAFLDRAFCTYLADVDASWEVESSSVVRVRVPRRRREPLAQCGPHLRVWSWLAALDLVRVLEASSECAASPDGSCERRFQIVLPTPRALRLGRLRDEPEGG